MDIIFEDTFENQHGPWEVRVVVDKPYARNDVQRRTVYVSKVDGNFTRKTRYNLQDVKLFGGVVENEDAPSMKEQIEETIENAMRGVLEYYEKKSITIDTLGVDVNTGV